MTTKQIAKLCGVNESTVLRWAKKAAVKMPSIREKLESAGHGTPAVFALDEVIESVEQGRGKTYAALLRNSASEMPEPDRKMQLAHTDDRIGRLETLMAAQIGMVEKLIGAVAAVASAPRQIEFKQDYFTILGYSNKIGVQLAFSDALGIGRHAARLSREKNIEIRKADDERFGQVNSYHIDILKEVFQS